MYILAATTYKSIHPNVIRLVFLECNYDCLMSDCIYNLEKIYSLSLCLYIFRQFIEIRLGIHKQFILDGFYM